MTQLSDVFSMDLLAQMQEQGMVRHQVHPHAPYTILNYTEKAAFDNVWNDVTLACRGLIYNHDTLEVIARPFRKFMNYGQTGAAVIGVTEQVVVTDKMDGSLGILYRLPNGDPAIATRGSFTSDQALHATEVLHRKYPGFGGSFKVMTLLFEILYPENRIVLNYGDMDDLVLLGAVQIASGVTVTPSQAAFWYEWPGPVTKTFPYNTLAEALAAPPRDNAEGFVVHSLLTDERIKIKQEDYIALHKIVTNLSERAVWEQIIAGKTSEQIIAPLPDEFHEWTAGVINRLLDAVLEMKLDLYEAYSMIVQNLDIKFGTAQWDRKEFAQAVAHRNDKWAMFMVLDGQHDRLFTEVWKRVKPEAFLTPAGVVHNEDTA